MLPVQYWFVKEQCNCIAATGGSKAFDFWWSRAIDRRTNHEVGLQCAVEI